MNRDLNTNMDGETRREFIKKSSLAAAAVAASGIIKTPVYGQNQAPSTGKVIGANDRIVCAYVGVGSQGMAHVKIQAQHASENNIAQVAVCDVSKFRCNHAKEAIQKFNAEAKIELFDDYRKLMERKDIDAVTVSTVDHWHTKICVAALESGKHIYVEKPMTRYLGEAFELHDTVKKTGKILQVGSQGCSAAAWHKAAEMIKEGKIGQLVWAQGYYCRNNPKGEWNYPIQPWATDGDIDWNQWISPVTKKVKFSADHYFRWRKYYPYCGGLLGDLVPHRLNPLMVATGNPEFPSRVVSIGTRNVHTDKNTENTAERDVPEHVELLAEFPSGLSLVIGASTVNAKSPGFVIYGHKATLNIGNMGERIELVPEQAFSEEIDAISLDGLKPTEDIAVHEKNWFDCIRSGKQPNCGIDLATRVQTVISLAEMSERLKIACCFDEKTRKVTTGNGQEIKPLTYGSNPLS